MVRKVKSKTTKVANIRTKKIVKPILKKKQVTRLSPKKKEVPKKIVSSKKRVYYRVNEDSKIIAALTSKSEKTTKTEIAKGLVPILGRSVESIRDRMKRFISRMSPNDCKEIMIEVAKNPDFYVHFQKPTSGYRKIEKIVANAPTLINKKIKKKKKNLKPTGKSLKTEKTNYNWLISKLQDNDPYFSVDNGVQLLNCIFNELQNINISKAQIENLIKNVECDMTLEDIFNNLNVKRQ